MLASVLNIHDRVRGEVYKLGQVLLRPALAFRLRLISWPRARQSRRFRIGTFSHHPLLFYISDEAN